MIGIGELILIYIRDTDGLDCGDKIYLHHTTNP